MLGLVTPHDHGEERRLLLPPPTDGHPEHGPGDPAFGVANLGVVGEVAGEARAGLGHGPAPSCCLPGGLPCPWNPGDGGHRGMPREPQGQAVEPTKSAMDETAEHARLGCRLGGGALAAWGRACQHRPARSLHPRRGGRMWPPPCCPGSGHRRWTAASGVRPVDAVARGTDHRIGGRWWDATSAGWTRPSRAVRRPRSWPRT
jgi:hypothetical protein